eukprot:849593-Amphidinium_carterae.1
MAKTWVFGPETPFDIEVACDRVRFSGWAAYYTWSEHAQWTYLSRRALGIKCFAQQITIQQRLDKSQWCSEGRFWCTSRPGLPLR